MTASEEDLEIYKRIADNYANELSTWKEQRFRVFGSSETYPQGGWNDTLGCGATLDEAKEILIECLPTGGLGWWHIVDMATGETVARG
jgi:hypothetical protein